MAGRYGRDAQKTRVYKWETQYAMRFHPAAYDVRINIIDAKRWVQKVWTEQSSSGKPAPRVQCGKRLWYRAGDHKMNLQRDSRKLVVLHELAHAIVRDEPCFRNDQSHGAVFVRTYIHLVNCYMGFNDEHATADARRHGVSVATSAYMQQRRAAFKFDIKEEVA